MKNKNLFKNEWNEWQNMHQSLPILQQQQIRAGASFKLSQEMEGSGCGISSSDINHSMFDIWKSVGKNLEAYINECIELYAKRLSEVIRW